MPDEKKPDLNNVRMIFRTLAIERGMPETALKYVNSLGLSKKDYNSVISQGMSKKERDRATEIVMGIGKSRPPFTKAQYEGGAHPLDPAVDTVKAAGSAAKEGASGLLRKVRGKPKKLTKAELDQMEKDADDFNLRGGGYWGKAEEEIDEGFYEVLRRMGAKLR
jgi:hypothetical protein